MGKSRRANKEFTREQKLIKENRELKRELIHLRKQIARVDKKSLEVTKKMSKEHQEKEQNNSIKETNENLEHLKKIWACNKCQTGILEIFLYSKVGKETFYYRQCDSCPNTTKGQRYTHELVCGIINSSQKSIYEK